MAKKFCNVDDEVLIDQLREFPCLYDHENKDFKDFQIRENIWSRIGKVLLKTRKYNLYFYVLQWIIILNTQL